MENQQKSQEIITLNNQIVQMQQYIDSQKDEIKMLRGQLQKAREKLLKFRIYILNNTSTKRLLLNNRIQDMLINKSILTQLLK